MFKQMHYFFTPLGVHVGFAYSLERIHHSTPCQLMDIQLSERTWYSCSSMSSSLYSVQTFS